MNKLYIFLGVLLFFGVWAVGGYNNLVGLSQAVDNQWGQVETQYQRRYDLIPNLVKATEAILKQEQKIFKDLADARTRYGGTTPGSADRQQAALGLDSALSRLLVVMENYPVLKSNETVARLMDELAGTENRISVERSRYNDTVTTYNIAVKTIPTSLLAGITGYKEKPLFKADSGAQIAPKVEINN